MLDTPTLIESVYPSSSNAAYVKKHVSKDFFRELSRKMEEEDLTETEGKVILQEELIKNVGFELLEAQGQNKSLKQDFIDLATRHEEEMKALRAEMTALMGKEINKAVKEALAKKSKGAVEKTIIVAGGLAGLVGGAVVGAPVGPAGMFTGAICGCYAGAQGTTYVIEKIS